MCVGIARRHLVECAGGGRCMQNTVAITRENGKIVKTSKNVFI